MVTCPGHISFSMKDLTNWYMPDELLCMLLFYLNKNR
jgi:hypothetical protein